MVLNSSSPPRIGYVLKADIQKFFPSLDHENLKAFVARKIKDQDVMWLVGQIIDHSNPHEEVVNYFPAMPCPLPNKGTSVVVAIPIGYDSVITNASLEGYPEHERTRESYDPHWAVATGRVRASGWGGCWTARTDRSLPH